MSKNDIQSVNGKTEHGHNSAVLLQQKNMIREWIEGWLTVHLKLSKTSLRGDIVLAEHGLDSVLSVELVADLEDYLECDLDDTLLWTYPNVDALVEYLISMRLLDRLTDREIAT